MRDAARELDDLEPARHFAGRVARDLAVLARDDRGERLAVALDQLLELEHDARTTHGRDRGPRRLRGLRARDGAIDVRLARERDARLHAPERRVVHVAP